MTVSNTLLTVSAISEVVKQKLVIRVKGERGGTYRARSLNFLPFTPHKNAYTEQLHLDYLISYTYNAQESQ